MSRAFVKEPDGEEVVADLPERPVSQHRNFVTAAGQAQIGKEIARLRRDLSAAKAGADKAAVASVSRDLRYWMARESSAELVEPPDGDEVRFGTKVTIERGDGRRQTFRITGEDEADPSAGTLSYVSPLARLLVGRGEGDEIAFQDDTIAVIALDQTP